MHGHARLHAAVSFWTQLRNTERRIEWINSSVLDSLLYYCARSWILFAQPFFPRSAGVPLFSACVQPMALCRTWDTILFDAAKQWFTKRKKENRINGERRTEHNHNRRFLRFRKRIPSLFLVAFLLLQSS